MSIAVDHPAWAILRRCFDFDFSHNTFSVGARWYDSPRLVVVIEDNIPRCGFCDDIVYTRCQELTDHTFTARDSKSCTWFSNAMSAPVHSCGVDISTTIKDFAEALDPIYA